MTIKMLNTTSYTCRRCFRLTRNIEKINRDSKEYQCLDQTARKFSIKPLGTQSRKHLPNRSLLTRGISSAISFQLSSTLDYIKSQTGLSGSQNEDGRLLTPENLFHPFSKSPLRAIRERAKFIKKNSYCPHPDHHQTRLPLAPDDPEARKKIIGATPPAHVSFDCPYCGIPSYCSEEHWADDYETHLEICDTLRQVNEDDHDLHSGRFFPEFSYPNYQIEEAMINMTNWDTFLYSREFQAINNERSLRQVTKLLTYPITIGSILHELSPYNIKKGGRLTVEGLKSLSALRYNLHPPKSGAGPGIKGLRPKAPPVRIFVVGARAESSLPRDVWMQLIYLFPRSDFHLILIGPESMMNRDQEFPLPERTSSNPFGAIVEDRISPQLKISTYVEYYHTLHKANHFYPYDPYFDCFMLFHPGIGHPIGSHEWRETIPLLLETKVPILATGYTQFDMERDVDWVKKNSKGEVDILLEPEENRFRSLRWDLNDMDPQDITCSNWGVWAFRGKRYEAERANSKYLLATKFRSNWVIDAETGDYSTCIPSPTGIAIDPALASYGVQQSHELAAHLRTLSPPIERIYSSPFYRCLQTITPTYDTLSALGKVADPSVLKIRSETGFGEWHGTARFDHPSPAEPEILKKLFPHYDEKYKPYIKPSLKGETIDELHDRCAYALHKVIEQSDQEGVEAILISTHAAPLIAIGRVLTGRMPENVTEEDFRPFTCGLSTFVRQEPQKLGSEVQDEKVVIDGPIPRVMWKDKKGVGGSCWKLIVNGDCSFLSGGEERGWRFSGEESFLGSNSSTSLDAGSSLGFVVKNKRCTASDPSML